MIIIEDPFLGEENCKYLKGIAIQNEKEAAPFRDIHILNLLSLNNKMSVKLSMLLSNYLAFKNIIAYPELMQLTIWPKNSKQHLHFDETRDSTVLTSITYLNDDYEGGETYFENGVVIKPEMGKTVFFDGMKYKHGVNPVTKGKRFVLATWYTDNINLLYI
jgi:predicted 2-oxoglutarate/Fe(II)-dependent dioxygenase YbiX